MSPNFVLQRCKSTFALHGTVLLRSWNNHRRVLFVDLEAGASDLADLHSPESQETKHGNRFQPHHPEGPRQ
jgi:hypothetical protein